MSAFYKIGDFAEKTGLSISTLRRWDKEGKLKPAKVTEGGTRLYTDNQLKLFSCRLQGKRVRKTKELMKSLQEDGD